MKQHAAEPNRETVKSIVRGVRPASRKWVEGVRNALLELAPTLNIADSYHSCTKSHIMYSYPALFFLCAELEKRQNTDGKSRVLVFFLTVFF